MGKMIFLYKNPFFFLAFCKSYRDRTCLGFSYPVPFPGEK